MDKLAFIVVESDLRWRFFRRFTASLNQLGYEVAIVTTCPSVYFRKKDFKGKIHLLSSRKVSRGLVAFPAKEILEVESGALGQTAVNKIATSWMNDLDVISQYKNPDVCFIYNGTTILPYTLKQWCIKNDIPACFFELANIDGKMFVDPMGTNAKSYLYKNIDILKRTHITDVEYNRWLKKYREEYSRVRQAKFSGDFKTVCWFLINQLYFMHYIDSIVEKTKFIKHWGLRFINRYVKRKGAFEDDVINVGDYYLFPMQVSVDSQILLNSDVNLHEALMYAVKKAREDGAALIIKTHPAEQNKRIIYDLNKIKSEEVKIVNSDIKKLIKNAKKIVTINSTVGLESILHNKKVEFLGKTFYSNFVNNSEYLKSYICDYLINIDYFAENDIEEDIVKMCIQRAEMR